LGDNAQRYDDLDTPGFVTSAIGVKEKMLDPSTKQEILEDLSDNMEMAETLRLIPSDLMAAELHRRGFMGELSMTQGTISQKFTMTPLGSEPTAEEGEIIVLDDDMEGLGKEGDRVRITSAGAERIDG